ncbi:MAG: pyridoxamine 5'-phosphate oxidase [Ginsengibacter sp.]
MALNIQIAELRKDYKQQILFETEADADPIKQFGKWWDEAIKSQAEEINAMTLATCNNKGYPSARIVLLKGFSEEGFIFFTNYESRKGIEIRQNPHACLVFFWKELERQVRIEGEVKKINEAESNEYFLVRPKESRLSAWSSPQSRVIKARDVLEEKVEHYRQVFADGNIPRPEHWGGYIVKPFLIEFWQGRASRLHDRLQYSLIEKNWHIDRLAP